MANCVDEQSDFISEGPLSPILKTSTRKLPKRLQRKSRVKLSNRFAEDSFESSKDESSTFPFTNEELEKIEGECIRDSQIKNEVKDFEFKKPESPVDYIKKGEYPLQTVQCGGFKTAGGKNIGLSLSDDMIEQSKKLFNDILNTGGNTVENMRTNKYSFLSKSKPSFEMSDTSCDNEKNTKTCDSIKNELDIRNDFPVPDHKFVFNQEEKPFTKLTCFGFTASGRGVLISKAACQRFSKEHSDCNSISDLKYLENSNKLSQVDKQETNFLSTQETNELFSDCTFWEDNPFNKEIFKNEHEDFKGFSEGNFKGSHKYAQDFSAALLKLSKEVEIYDKNPRTSSAKLSNTKAAPTLRKAEEIQIQPKNKTCSTRSISPLKDNTLNSKNKKKIEKTLFVGFSMASGRKVQITESSLNTAKLGFGEEFNSCFPTCNNFKSEEVSYLNSQELDDLFGTFDTQQNKPDENKNSIEEINRKTDDFTCVRKYSDDETTLLPNLLLQESHSETLKVAFESNGFSTASGSRITVSNVALCRAQEILKNVDELKSDTAIHQDIKYENKKPSRGFQTAAGSSVNLSEDALKRANKLFQSIDNDLSWNNSDQNIKPDEITKPDISFWTSAGSSINISEDALKRVNKLSHNIDDLSWSGSLKENSTLVESNTSLISSKNNANSSSRPHRKKRLGTSSCKPIHIPKHKLENALRFFENETSTTMSPIKTNMPSIYNSTPLKGVPIAHIDSEITPIKNVNNKFVVNNEFAPINFFFNDRFTIEKCTEGTVDSWDKILENEKRNLEMKLKVITEKQEFLRRQKQLMQNDYLYKRKRQNGVLFNKKQSSQRISLQHFLKIDSSSKKRLNFTHQNAECLHFNYTHENVSSVTTLDGACVIPNVNNAIGISEIETAFKIMAGVDQELIPNGWIRNHFKWIVWKLASYENFATNMKDCLTLENVIQQLKYRYDREIDGAERSTLRKIFETDDAPQKRMVLCVSYIFEIQNGQFELELTDGWYSIRTVLDQPLCKQVHSGKIRIGTKLVTYGAELLNCEGCHPLEAADLVRLKVCCNSTRRTRWYAKLGYQKCPEPLPVKLHSLFPDGGLISCIKIFVARIYPIKYMEKQNKLTIWRNRKAEELRAQEWENKVRQDMEKLRETIMKDYEMNVRSTRLNRKVNLSDDEIRDVDCPETLFSLYENSMNPERLQELLSSSQKKALMGYRQELSFKRQQEMLQKIEQSAGKLQAPKRDVSSVLQLLVLDALHPSEKAYGLQIWRPSEVHLDTIKEGSVFYVYNVLPKKNGDLSTMSRTKFQITSDSIDEFCKYKRTLLTISEVTQLTNKLVFNEFDTAGIVIAMAVNDYSQLLWLADSFGRLLCIKVYEGPKNCLLLDKLKIGQVVAASNLIFCESKFEFSEAIANHVSVISCYPQHKHLQAGINELSPQLPKDLKLFLEQCTQKISYYVDKVDIIKDHKRMSSVSLPQSCSSATSDFFDDSSDVLYSMIDVDKFE